MGMYVLDEVAGWHGAYDDTVGHEVVRETVTRDVNHPCILFWDNGNESGWNTKLDGDFAQIDPQRRHVLHPWAKFDQVDTKHYPDYKSLTALASGDVVYFPTEFLHGLYDGGAGAGLADYWEVIRKSKVTAGGFIWAFLDEAPSASISTAISILAAISLPMESSGLTGKRKAASSPSRNSGRRSSSPTRRCPSTANSRSKTDTASLH